MKIFLSWSGKQSGEAAKAVSEWLPSVIQAVDPWMSATDIEAGARWSPEIQAELESIRFGILFVTRSNVDAPWLLFEAGALAKTLEGTYVCPLLLNLKPADLPGGPLTQFQSKQADKSGTLQLVQTINRALDEQQRIPDGRLEQIFEKWWPDLESSLAKIEDDTGASTEPRRTEDMVEEVLTIVRQLQRSEPSPVISPRAYFSLGPCVHDADSQQEETVKRAIREIEIQLADNKLSKKKLVALEEKLAALRSEWTALIENRLRLQVLPGQPTRDHKDH